MAVAVRLEHVSRHFGDVRAVDDVCLEIEEGEFFSILGPSGSGKTTCLRLIAGFEQPTSGEIVIAGRPAAGVPPYTRDVNTVFQDYALFPHMSVADNVAYGLMVRGVNKGERRRRAGEMLALVELADLGSRKPAMLSGGQRQRVALARALINHPKVLLLDEPLGALDLKLREQMRVELKALQRRLETTFVYVTHDQEEALSMSDRLAVFNHGKIEQIGRPEVVYEHPATVFVAGFVGVSNLMTGALARRAAGSDRPFSVRPENIRFATDQATGDTVCTVAGSVADLQYLGASTRYLVELEGGGFVTVIRQNAERGAGKRPATLGDRVRLAWDRDAMQPVRDSDTEAAP